MSPDQEHAPKPAPTLPKGHVRVGYVLSRDGAVRLRFAKERRPRKVDIPRLQRRGLLPKGELSQDEARAFLGRS